jgi:hypothetical protein
LIIQMYNEQKKKEWKEKKEKARNSNPKKQII